MLRVGSISWPFSFPAMSVWGQAWEWQRRWVLAKLWWSFFTRADASEYTRVQEFLPKILGAPKKKGLMMTCTIFTGFQLRRSGTTFSVLQNKTLRIEKWSVFQKDDCIPRLVHFLPQVSRNARQSLKHGWFFSSESHNVSHKVSWLKHRIWYFQMLGFFHR